MGKATFSHRKGVGRARSSARSLRAGRLEHLEALGAVRALVTKAKRYRTSTARTLGLAGGSSGRCEETRAMKAAVIGGPAVNKGEQLWEV